MKLVIAAFVTATLCLAAGCGDDGDSGGIDAAASVDAAATDAGPDAQMASLCETMCTCASTFCSQDLNDCLAECAQIPVSVATCRNTHCGYAQSNATVHCPHVAGDENAPGTPLECIYDLADAGVPDAN
jgi:hypothetical protein